MCITSGGRTETLSFDQRIHSLVVSVTQLVVTHVSRALHPAHRLAFTTALCAAISADAGTLTPPAWRAVLDPSVLDEVGVATRGKGRWGAVVFVCVRACLCVALLTISCVFYPV